MLDVDISQERHELRLKGTKKEWLMMMRALEKKYGKDATLESVLNDLQDSGTPTKAQIEIDPATPLESDVVDL